MATQTSYPARPVTPSDARVGCRRTGDASRSFLGL